MSSTYISDHIVRAKNRLIEQYRGKPKIEGVLEAIVAPIQDIEDVLEQLKIERWIETAIGVQLDKIGRIVGAEREIGQNDDDFRLVVKAQIIMNLNQGTPEEIISAAKFFIGAAFIWYLEVYPAAVDIFSTTVIPEPNRAKIRAQLKKFLPAGVSLDSFGQFDETNPFIFSGGAGFGDVNDPGVGGLLADLY